LSVSKKTTFHIMDEVESVDSFVMGAGTHTAHLSSIDKKSKPTTGINLRLNDYEMSLIRKLSEKEERSQQQVLRRILIPALEKALKRGL